MLALATLALAALAALVARRRPADRFGAAIAPASLARQAQAQPVEAARRRLHLVGGGRAVVAQDDPATARRVGAHAELPVPQMRQAAVFAGGAVGADTDEARLDPRF